MDLCALHGDGEDLAGLVGRRLERVVASWHLYGGEGPSGPLDVWLIDGEGNSTRVTTASDWCLVVETADPSEGYDMAGYGRVEVAQSDGGTPFEAHMGEEIVAAGQEWGPGGERQLLEIIFATGGVRCESWSGELRVSAALAP